MQFGLPSGLSGAIHPPELMQHASADLIVCSMHLSYASMSHSPPLFGSAFAVCGGTEHGGCKEQGCHQNGTQRRSAGRGGQDPLCVFVHGKASVGGGITGVITGFRVVGVGPPSGPCSSTGATQFPAEFQTPPLITQQS